MTTNHKPLSDADLELFVSHLACSELGRLSLAEVLAAMRKIEARGVDLNAAVAKIREQESANQESTEQESANQESAKVDNASLEGAEAEDEYEYDDSDDDDDENEIPSKPRTKSATKHKK